GVECTGINVGGNEMARVVVIARVEAKSGKGDELMPLLQAQIPPTRQEKGCINYDLLRDRANPDLFFFHETWESDADLENHIAAPHIQGSREKRAPFVDSAVVHRLDKIEP
ncbi:MAG: putative quinol monooxygenase, partial [Pseudomonadota bacterium]